MWVRKWEEWKDGKKELKFRYQGQDTLKVSQELEVTTISIAFVIGARKWFTFLGKNLKKDIFLKYTNQERRRVFNNQSDWITVKLNKLNWKDS